MKQSNAYVGYSWGLVGAQAMTAIKHWPSETGHEYYAALECFQQHVHPPPPPKAVAAQLDGLFSLSNSDTAKAIWKLSDILGSNLGHTVRAF
jgi:hypothetical protein